MNVLTMKPNEKANVNDFASHHERHCQIGDRVLSSWFDSPVFRAGWTPEPDLFALPVQREIARVAASVGPGLTVDNLVLALDRADKLKFFGGGADDVIRSVRAPFELDPWPRLEELRQLAARRRLLDVVERAKVALLGDSQLGQIQERLLDAARDRADKRAGVSVTEVLDGWTTDGALVHEPTGITGLDDLTGGGPVYGSRWYLSGAPDAGKTALLVQWLHRWAIKGIPVGLLAVDEDPDDIVTRLAQRAGYLRSVCEIRDTGSLYELRLALGGLTLRIYSSAWTIEAAATDLARYAKTAGHPAILGVDSLQTVQCEAERVREHSEVAAITARTKALRAAATEFRMLTICTSEMARSAYKSRNRDEQTETMAASKWSGAVEYSARVLIGLRSVAGQKDLVELDVAKNKHGPRDAKVFLKLDRRGQQLTEVQFTPQPKTREDREESERVQRIERSAKLKDEIRQLFAKTPEQGGTAEIASALGRRKADVGVALAELVRAGELEAVGSTRDRQYRRATEGAAQ